MLHVNADFPHPGSIALALDTGERVRINQRNDDGSFSIIDRRSVRRVAADQLVADGNDGAPLDWRPLSRFTIPASNYRPLADAADWRHLPSLAECQSAGDRAAGHQLIRDHLHEIRHRDEMRDAERQVDRVHAVDVIEPEADERLPVDRREFRHDVPLGTDVDNGHMSSPAEQRRTLAAGFRGVIDDIDQAVRDTLDTALELHRVTRTLAGLTVGTAAMRDCVDYQQELIDRVHARANSAGVAYHDLIRACDDRIAADRRAHTVGAA